MLLVAMPTVLLLYLLLAEQRLILTISVLVRKLLERLRLWSLVDIPLQLPMHKVVQMFWL